MFDRDAALEILDPLLERLDLDLVLRGLCLGGLRSRVVAVGVRAQLVELAFELGLAIDERHRGLALRRELAHRRVELGAQLLQELVGLRGELLLEVRELRRYRGLALEQLLLGHLRARLGLDDRLRLELGLVGLAMRARELA